MGFSPWSYVISIIIRIYFICTLISPVYLLGLALCIYPKLSIRWARCCVRPWDAKNDYLYTGKVQLENMSSASLNGSTQGSFSARPYDPTLSGSISAPFLYRMLLCVLGHSVVSDSCNPMGCSSAGSPVHGMSHIRILEWAAISSSGGSFQPRNQTHCTGRQILYHRAT